jgi:hypothetical protein
MRAPSLFIVALGLAGCFDAGEGTEPPPNRFNFPVGLAVSPGGGVLYAANSNFDLQWNGGTLQAYDLSAIRRDVLTLIDDPAHFPRDLLVDPASLDECGAKNAPQGAGQMLGQQCAPPVRSDPYFRSSVTIGAFATDLQLAPDGTRIFTPVRGDASLTWATVAADAPGSPPNFLLDCGQGAERRCDAAHRAGNDPDEPGNSRHLTMPGEPFGMALSEDGEFALVTHQIDTKTSLLSTGEPPPGAAGTTVLARPSLQYVFDGVNTGGVGITAVPHDPEAFPECLRSDLANPASPLRDPDACARVLPRPAFLQTSRSTAKVDLLRLYVDEGYRATPSQPSRPFLQREAEFEVVANAGNFDSRGIVVDPTPRIACKARVLAETPLTADERDRQTVECARLPARVFIANRSPESLLIGEVGETSASGDAYDPDRLSIKTSVPLSFGPSRVYLAPVIETDGTYGLRVFVVCFDSSVIYVFDPNANNLENIIHVGDGPFAMAFDPFSMDDVAKHAVAPLSGGPGAPHSFRFGYVAVFRNSHLQVLDLDDSVAKTPGKYTYQSIVYTLGQPTEPKGGL